MMKTQSVKIDIPVPSNFAKRPNEIQQQTPKIKVSSLMVPISWLPVLATPWGSRPDAGNCTKSDNVNVFSDVNFTTNAEENDSDDQEEDNISCLENKIINEDNSYILDSVLGLDNDKTLNILGQEMNDFWTPPDYILHWYKKISITHVKNPSKNLIMTAITKNSCMVFKHKSFIPSNHSFIFLNLLKMMQQRLKLPVITYHTTVSL